MFSDTTGQFEAVIFSDLLNQSRNLLEPGTPVIVGVEAERDGDAIKMRVQSLEALDAAVGAVQRGLRIELRPDVFLGERGQMALQDLRACLRPGAGQIRLVMPVQEAGRSCELTLKGRFDTGPQARGELGTVEGLMAISELA
jgi:DNA polymerase-3 subunit alpha